MKCNQHKKIDAIGICRNCSVFICNQCKHLEENKSGLVCSLKCKSKVLELLSDIEAGRNIKEKIAEDRFAVAEQIRENNLDKQRIQDLYKNLAKQEKFGFYLSSAVSFSLFGYCVTYAKFFDWYFAFGLGIILLVLAFNAYHKSIAFQKYYLE